jgi:hypothetical protein
LWKADEKRVNKITGNHIKIFAVKTLRLSAFAGNQENPAKALRRKEKPVVFVDA